ncbi:MAG: alpha-amylase family glycosyl hydrolase [Myxococcota bacterium]
MWVFLTGCAPAPSISLEGEGREAWAFEVVVSGRASESCDDVWVETPRGLYAAAREGDRFSARVGLSAGENEVIPACGRGQKVTRGEAQRWTVRLEDRPRAFARVSYGDDGLLLDGGGSSPSEARAADLVSYTWEALDGDLEIEGDGPIVTVRNPGEDGEYRVRLTVTDADGVSDSAVAMFRVWYEEALVMDVDREHPAWVDDAVVYGVVPFFFGDGGFADVIDRLDEIEALGATVLWLSPVTDCPDDDFGYAVTNHFGLRDTFGPEEDFRLLVDEAHARGMKVILDFVPNHTSDEHPYWSGAYDGFYDDEVPYYFEWDNLRNLDYDNPEVQRMMVEAFAYWVREYDVDGFRADVAWGVKDRAPEFWPVWRQELKRVKPDLLLLAEASARDPYWFDHGFDVAYDWTWELGEWAWGSAWESDDVASALADALTNEGEGFDEDALVFRFLNNNDTGERFVTRYGAERVPAAAALLLTVPGVPCVFVGDEVGAAFEPYDEGPPVVWEDTYELTPVYERLIRLRRDLSALHSREWEILHARDDVLVYLRKAEDPSEDVLVALNFGDAAASVSVDAFAEETELQDLYGDVAVGWDGTVALDAFGVRILARPSL